MSGRHKVVSPCTHTIELWDRVPCGVATLATDGAPGLSSVKPTLAQTTGLKDGCDLARRARKDGELVISVKGGCESPKFSMPKATCDPSQSGCDPPPTASACVLPLAIVGQSGVGAKADRDQKLTETRDGDADDVNDAALGPEITLTLGRRTNFLSSFTLGGRRFRGQEMPGHEAGEDEEAREMIRAVSAQIHF